MSAVSLVVALVLVVVAVVVAVVLLRRRRRSDAVVLYGPPAGKTALYYRLKTGNFVESVSSMKENEGTFVWRVAEGAPAGAIHTVDIPGHGRLRWRLKDFLPVARTIVFVVDATLFGKPDYTREAAAMLFDVLSDSTTIALRLPVVVACNKSEDLLAYPWKRIKTLLEAEMTTLRKTRSKYPTLHEETAGQDDGANNIVADNDSAEFTFDDSPVAVQFVTISVKKNDLKQLVAAVAQ